MSEDTSHDQVSPPAEDEDLELSDEQADDVRGGKPPSPPSGPQPIPYPN